METTKSIEWNQEKVFRLEMEIQHKFDTWLTNVFLPDNVRKLFVNLTFGLGHPEAQRISWSASDLYHEASCKLVTSDYTSTLEQFTKDLNSLFATTSEPVVGCMRFTRRSLKDGSIRYKLTNDKRRMKLFDTYWANRSKHLRLAMYRLDNGLPIGEFVFP